MSMPDAGRIEITAVEEGSENPPTVVTTRIRENGHLSMLTQDYEWSDGFNMFVGLNVTATLRLLPNGTVQGSTGTPPNQKAFTGTWRRL